MENNIYLNSQEREFIKEILLEEMKEELLSKYAKAVMMTVIQKLNEY